LTARPLLRDDTAMAKSSKKNKRAPKKPPTKPLPMWNVVLLNDDDHSYEYVIDMLAKTCGHPPETGLQLARVVDTQERAIVFTAHKELAELKADLINNFGADPRIMSCRGSMSAVIEAMDG
jgi:ATP-dependent Clp protease adaptor protein ClpS